MDIVEQSLKLRPTRAADLDFVLALEQHPDNRPFIAQWSRDEHSSAIERSDREHWIIEREPDQSRLGYIIMYNLIAQRLGVYVKRIVVSDKSRGIGRIALWLLAEHAFRDLNADFMFLAVYPDNERGQRSYRALGFTEVALTASERRTLQDAVGGFRDTSLVMYVWPHMLRAPDRRVWPAPASGRG